MEERCTEREQSQLGGCDLARDFHYIFRTLSRTGNAKVLTKGALSATTAAAQEHFVQGTRDTAAASFGPFSSQAVVPIRGKSCVHRQL